MVIYPLIFVAFYNFCYKFTVPAGHRAVIFNRSGGVKQETIDEGTHFLIPWLQKAIIYDARTQFKNISSPTGSKGTLSSSYAIEAKFC